MVPLAWVPRGRRRPGRAPLAVATPTLWPFGGGRDETECARGDTRAHAPGTAVPSGRPASRRHYPGCAEALVCTITSRRPFVTVACLGLHFGNRLPVLVHEHNFQTRELRLHDRPGLA
jgi:hypothetical protein